MSDDTKFYDPSGPRPDIRLVVTDMDGTLLRRDHSLPDGFWELERRLHESGIVFAVASGRQYWNLAEFFQPIRDRLLILAENGTMVMQGGEELHLQPLARPDAHRFIDLGRTLLDTHVLLCGREAAYVDDPHPEFMAQIAPFYHRIRIVPDLKEVDDHALKVTFCDFNGAETHAYPAVRPFEAGFKVAVAGIPWLDITHGEANKGTAIARIRERMGIARDQVLAFGDYLNDLEMMAEAGFAFAMRNAHPRILEAARHATRLDNESGGVLETIREVCF